MSIRIKTAVFFGFFVNIIFAQTLPVNCDLAIPGCTSPSFPITGQQPLYNTIDFTGASNPSTNPNPVPGNSGCLLSGETVSTFITISVVQSGTLQWSIQGPSGGCFDWIMWPYTPGVGAGVSPTCGQLQAGTLPPVACNWNGWCQGFTGMAPAGNLPPGADPSDFETPLNVTAGQTFLLCLSNYSGTNQNVNLSFFGTADVSCTPSVTDQTICLGDTAHVLFNTGGIVTPQYTWTPATGVDDPANGPDFNILVNTTTSYSVHITDATSTYDTTLNFTITVVNPPTPNAGTDFSVCQGSPAQLNGTPSDASDALTWSFIGPTGTPAPPNALFSPNNHAEDPTAQVNYMGTYTFILSEDNGVCPAKKDSVQVTFGNLVQTYTKTNPICADSCNGSITINSTGATQFSIDGGTTWSSINVFSNLCAGNYAVTSKNAMGCSANNVNVALTNPPYVMVTASADQTICVNDTTTVSATATGGTSYIYHWDQTSNTNAQQSVIPTASPSFYYVHAENQNGCLSLKDSVKIDWLPLISANISDNDTICPGDTSIAYAFNVSGGQAPYSFKWMNNTTTLGNDDSLTVNPSATTQYFVHITDACSTPETVLGTTIVMASVPKVSFTVDTAEQCQPADFTFINTSTLSDKTYWMFTNGMKYTNQDTVHFTENNPDKYDVQLIVESNQTCRDTLYADDFFVVHKIPSADFIWAPFSPKMFNPEVTFTDKSTDATQYFWSFTQGDPSTSTSPEGEKVDFPYGEVGYYPVVLTVKSDFGCVDSVRYVVQVISDVLFYAPNSFTPDGDSFNEVWKISIQGIDEYNFELMVYNRWGEIMWESHNPSAAWDGTYGGKIAPDGTYVWVVHTKDLVTDNKYEYKGTVTIIR
jgi:gliding motility-associated-like protein